MAIKAAARRTIAQQTTDLSDEWLLLLMLGLDE